MGFTEVGHNLLGQAIKAFEKETGLSVDVIAENALVQGANLDAIVKIADGEEPLAVEVKRWAQQANIGALANQVHNLPMKGLLVADYVNPRMAGKLKKQQVQFMDAAGNAYINALPVYIYITGNKPKDTLKLQKNTNKAFDPAGLKVVFGLLCDHELVNCTYREIAEQADVALGSIGPILQGLQNAGFLVERKKGERRLINQRRLLERWVETYPEKLRPKLHIGDFLSENPYWWKDMELGQFAGFWGGEIAAAGYTGYIRPAQAEIYMPDERAINKLLAAARLRKAPTGGGEEPGIVHIYKAFWRMSGRENDSGHKFARQQEALVPPILAYADLVASGDSRNMEAARDLYEQFIAECIRED